MFGITWDYIFKYVNHLFNFVRYIGLINPKSLFTNKDVELLSVILNGDVDITDTVNEQINTNEITTVRSLISENIFFEELEISAVINGELILFIHKNLDDIIYFQYGLEWSKYLNCSDVKKRLQYLDLSSS